MEMIVNKGKRVKNPTIVDIETALMPILTYNNYLIILQKSEDEWLRAIWKSTIGIKLEYKNPETCEIFEDTEVFISRRKTITLFQSYAKNYNGWKDQVKWIKQGGKSFKSTLSKILRPVQTFLFIVFITVIIALMFHFNNPNTTETANDYFSKTPLVYGLLTIILGFGTVSVSYVNFMYRNEIGTDRLPALFIYGSIILIFGLIVLLGGIFR